MKSKQKSKEKPRDRSVGQRADGNGHLFGLKRLLTVCVLSPLLFVALPAVHASADDRECVDTDGDGWGWKDPDPARGLPGESCRVGDPPDPVDPGPGGSRIVNRNTGGGVADFQAADMVFATNPWNTNLSGDQFLEWDVNHNGDSSSTGPCDPRSITSATLRYKLTDSVGAGHNGSNDTTTVRAFPAVVLGTMGGRDQSWGRSNHPSAQCNVDAYGDLVEMADPNAPGASQQDRWIIDRLLGVGNQNHGAELNNPSSIRVNMDHFSHFANRHILDMKPVKAHTGFPVKASELVNSGNPVKVAVKANLDSAEGAKGVANIFLDTYWHDVDNAATVPDNRLVGGINGINEDRTEVWNLNIWFDYPGGSATTTSWTGGVKIGEVSFGAGPSVGFDIHVKAEGHRNGRYPTCRLGQSDNCFIYVALVAQDENLAKRGVTVDYQEIARWFRSSTFSNLIRNPGGDENRQIANQIWKRIDGGNGGDSDTGPAFPGEKDYVIGGLHLGSEIWFNPGSADETNSSQSRAAAIEFQAIGFEANGRTFGLFRNF